MAPIVDLSEDQRRHARRLLQQAAKNPISYPDALQKILVDIIKPLFTSSFQSSSTTNDKITDTGRKRLIPLPSVPGNFNDSYDALTDDPSSIIKRQPWKNGWTIPLIQDLLTTHYYSIPTVSAIDTLSSTVAPRYDASPPTNTRKKTIESHFHLFIPPILHIIDDTNLSYRSQGCDCLTALCHLLSTVDSDIMSRSGLGEVFITTLQGNLSWLPPLTEEKEAMKLLRSLYPAYFETVKIGLATSTARLKPSTVDKKPMSTKSSDIKAQSQSSHLTYLLRHGILHGLSHLSSTGLTNPTNTTSPSITAFLLSQLSPLIVMLGPTATRRHTQYLFPLLRNITSDPFVLTESSSTKPEADGSKTDDDGDTSMLAAALQATQTLTQTLTLPPPSSPRTRGETKSVDLQHWSGECLRGLVACYLNVQDELEPCVTPQPKSETGLRRFDRVVARLKMTTRFLVRNTTVDVQESGDTGPTRGDGDGRKGWEDAIGALMAIDDRIAGLFEGCFDGNHDDDNDNDKDSDDNDVHVIETVVKNAVADVDTNPAVLNAKTEPPHDSQNSISISMPSETPRAKEKTKPRIQVLD